MSIRPLSVPNRKTLMKSLTFPWKLWLCYLKGKITTWQLAATCSPFVLPPLQSPVFRHWGVDALCIFDSDDSSSWHLSTNIIDHLCPPSVICTDSCPPCPSLLAWSLLLALFSWIIWGLLAVCNRLEARQSFLGTRYSDLLEESKFKWFDI